MRRRRPVSTTPPLAPRELRGFRVQDWIDPSEPATTEDGGPFVTEDGIDGGPMIRAYMRHRAAQDAWANEHGCHPQYPNGYGPTALRPTITSHATSLDCAPLRRLIPPADSSSRQRSCDCLERSRVSRVD